MLPNRFPYFCYHVLWDKKEKSTQINYTLEKEISMKKWNFYSNAFYLFIYFFIRFTYFNTVAQTFYILINSQEVSRKSRVSCTSILNLFFFFPQCTVTVFVCISLFYMVHFSTILFPWYVSIVRRESQILFIWIYYFCLT